MYSIFYAINFNCYNSTEYQRTGCQCTTQVTYPYYKFDCKYLTLKLFRIDPVSIRMIQVCVNRINFATQYAHTCYTYYIEWLNNMLRLV